MLNVRSLVLCYFEVLFDGFNIKSSDSARHRTRGGQDFSFQFNLAPVKFSCDSLPDTKGPVAGL